MGSGYVSEDYFNEARAIILLLVDHWRAGEIGAMNERARLTLERCQIFLAEVEKRRNMGVARQCVQCGTMFTPKRPSHARFCSTACQRQNNLARR